MLATSLELAGLTRGPLCRDRADMENSLDKYQWGWGGFVTRDRKRTQIRVRLLDPEWRREAKTSRPLMTDGAGRVSRHSWQVTPLLTIAHSPAAGLGGASCGPCKMRRS